MSSQQDMGIETSHRIERDFLGAKSIPKLALYGVQTQRAMENFDVTRIPINHFPKLIIALAMVKKSAALANNKIGLLPDQKSGPIIAACDEIILGQHHDSFLVDTIQGGAGTSTNMNANEVIANRALQIAGKSIGNYKFISPNDHVNLSQSTNDAYPTAIRVALLLSYSTLIDSLRELCFELDKKGDEFNHIIKIGRTQLQDAVPMTLGSEFKAFSYTIAEDIERLSEVATLMQEVNLGGTAIGTGINSTSEYSSLAIEYLSMECNKPLVRSKHLIEASYDTGAFVLFSGTLKRIAIKFSKICNDLRLLSSGPRAGIGEIILPPMQPGSSIMPGKVNPVIAEAVNQICFEVIGSDLTISMAAEGGQLQLNAFEPIIIFKLLSSIRLLGRGADILATRCINGIQVNEKRCTELVDNSIGVVTALTPYIGYNEACNIAQEALQKNSSPKDIILKKKLMSQKELEDALNPETMLM